MTVALVIAQQEYSDTTWKTKADGKDLKDKQLKIIRLMVTKGLDNLVG